MALIDYKKDMEMCCRCSLCKFIPMEKVKGFHHVNICPSISRYNFNAYSGAGRITMAMSLLACRIEYNNKLIEIINNCQMCGGCDIACKYGMDMEVLEPIYEFKMKSVQDGHSLPVLDAVINNMKQKGTMVPSGKTKRDHWAEGLDIKDYNQQKAEVIYHVGCRTCYDRDMWKVARATVELLKKAEVDVGIGGNNESCCGGRAYQMGYKEEFLRQANHNMEMFKKSGAKTLVTSCAECYQAFNVLCDKFGLRGDLDVLHITQYLDQLIEDGKLKPTKKVAATVTYHDPCYLGRLGEPYIPWRGKELPGARRLFDPPKEFRRGTYGVYNPPRNILNSIPGLKLVEMDRNKECAWCCGAGGGVALSNPEFAKWTAQERIDEARSTGAGALVTACPGCEQIFDGTIKQTGGNLKVYDIVELLMQSI